MRPLLSQIVPFIHPAIAWTALATGLIPVLIHFINRRRYRRLPWAAMSFLLAAGRRSARRLRIEQWLLLLVRAMVIVLLGLAVARPFLPAATPGLPGVARSHHLLLIDNSRSMNARDKTGATRLSLARKVAGELLASFPRTDAVSLVTLAQPAEAVIAHPSYERRFVREQLAAVRSTKRTTDTVGALSLALEIISASDFATNSSAVYLISDLPLDPWRKGSREDRPAVATAVSKVADSADLTVIRIARNDVDNLANLNNLAITRLSGDTNLVGVNRPIRIEVEVANFGPSRARGLDLMVESGGRILRRLSLPSIGPGRSTVTVLPLILDTPGTHAIQARILPGDSDALMDDDERFLSIEARDAIPVLLVDGRPGATLLKGQAGFLATALAPRLDSGDSHLIVPNVISEHELGGEVLTDYDLVALCNVQRLPEEHWERLERFVSDGGAALIFAGDLIDADNYNRLGYAEGTGLVPCRIGSVTGSPDRGPYTTISHEQLSHPIVAEFADLSDSGLFTARVSRYLQVEPDPARGEVVLRYETGEPALVLSRTEKGHTALVTTSPNMEWTNLPAKGDYVSLVHNLVEFMIPRRGDGRNIAIGDSITEPLTPAQRSLPISVTLSGGEEAPGRLVPHGDGLAFQHGPVEDAGVFTLAIGGETVRFVANVEPSESDLRSASGADVQAAVSGNVRFVADPSTIAGRRPAPSASELFLPMLYAVLALLLVEAYLAMRFGTFRHRAQAHDRPNGRPRVDVQRNDAAAGVAESERMKDEG